MDILNYVKVNDWIHTSGQPTAEQFSAIQQTGTKTVINLAMPDHKTAIANEGEIVTSLGMNFLHIPVVWDAPKTEQYQLFQHVMQAHNQQSIWIHCALNWRVSCFMYLYKTGCLGIPKDQAEDDLLSIWEPNEVWRQFIESND